MSAPILTFDTLRLANLHRLPTFRNAHGDPAHSEPDGSDWSLADWFTAFVGELGEVIEAADGIAAHISTPQMLADEIADAIIYLDIFAFRAGFSMADAARLFVEDRETMHFDIMTDMPLSARPWPSTSDYFGHALRLGNTLKKVSRGDLPWEGRGQGQFQVQNHCGYALAGLAAMACHSHITLSQAIARKFNVTSLKVHSPISLTLIDVSGVSAWVAWDRRTSAEIIEGVAP